MDETRQYPKWTEIKEGLEHVLNTCILGMLENVKTDGFKIINSPEIYNLWASINEPGMTGLKDVLYKGDAITTLVNSRRHTKLSPPEFGENSYVISRLNELEPKITEKFNTPPLALFEELYKKVDLAISKVPKLSADESNLPEKAVIIDTIIQCVLIYNLYYTKIRTYIEKNLIHCDGEPPHRYVGPVLVIGTHERSYQQELVQDLDFISKVASFVLRPKPKYEEVKYKTTEGLSKKGLISMLNKD